jgi:hypothetical protein
VIAAFALNSVENFDSERNCDKLFYWIVLRTLTYSAWNCWNSIVTGAAHLASPANTALVGHRRGAANTARAATIAGAATTAGAETTAGALKIEATGLCFL